MHYYMVLHKNYGVPLCPYQKLSQTSGLECNEETALTEEDSTKFILD